MDLWTGIEKMRKLNRKMLALITVQLNLLQKIIEYCHFLSNFGWLKNKNIRETCGVRSSPSEVAILTRRISCVANFEGKSLGERCFTQRAMKRNFVTGITCRSSAALGVRVRGYIRIWAGAMGHRHTYLEVEIQAQVYTVGQVLDRCSSNRKFSSGHAGDCLEGLSKCCGLV
ncbi:hypothetical protein QAD02_022325 [Eretmocerus hayati]|uniref:Uncharacterized protein n=1 Tax=Eretmocerus hayati TaxID=131215 RepID=A0ACC2PUT2_9HYME|nr:hypothetical protein QAD02_022325 [Eretmocerus hayati]